MAKSKATEWLSEDKLTLLTGWARNGDTNETIAKKMGINTSTLYDYINKFDNISNALKKGKEVIDIEVENALLKKALGYSVFITKGMKLKDIIYDNGKKVSEKERIEFYQEEMHVPADTTAQIFWLKNRKPDKWRDKVIDEEDENAINNAKEILVKIKNVADTTNDE